MVLDQQVLDQQVSVPVWLKMRCLIWKFFIVVVSMKHLIKSKETPDQSEPVYINTIILEFSGIFFLFMANICFFINSNKVNIFLLH